MLPQFGSVCSAIHESQMPCCAHCLKQVDVTIDTHVSSQAVVQHWGRAAQMLATQLPPGRPLSQLLASALPE